MISYDDYVEAKALMEKMASECGFRTVSSFVRYVNDTKKDMDEMHSVLTGQLRYGVSNDIPDSALLKTLTEKFDKLKEKGRGLSIQSKELLQLSKMSLRLSDKLAELALHILNESIEKEQIVPTWNKLTKVQERIQKLMKKRGDLVRNDVKELDNMIKHYITNDTESDED